MVISTARRSAGRSGVLSQEWAQPGVASVWWLRPAT